MKEIFDSEFEEAMNDSLNIVMIVGEDPCSSGNPLLNRRMNSSILSKQTFREDPGLFFSFIRSHFNEELFAPGEIHRHIAELQKKYRICVISESIDGLFGLAGIFRLVELYGSLRNCYCRNCFTQYSFGTLLYQEEIPRCGCGGIIRPDFVLSGEQVDGNRLFNAARALEEADRLIAIKTGLHSKIEQYLLEFYDGKPIIYR